MTSAKADRFLAFTRRRLLGGAAALAMTAPFAELAGGGEVSASPTLPLPPLDLSDGFLESGGWILKRSDLK